MYIYESPRKSPRKVSARNTVNATSEKTKSPGRKGKPPAGGKQKTSKRAEALAAATGMRRGQNIKKNASEDKENSWVTSRQSRQLRCSIAGEVSSKVTENPKSKVPENLRIPLRELQINSFADKLKKRDVAPSVEVAVPGPGIQACSNLKIAVSRTFASHPVEQTDNRTREQRSSKQLDEGVGIGLEWDMNCIR